MGEGVELVQRLAVVYMLGAHHADGLAYKRVAAVLEHGEEHLLFLEHVREQFVLHGFQVVGQAHGHVRVVAVHGFHAAGHADQLGQLLAVHLVIARQDVVDERAGRGSFGHGVTALQGGQLGQHGVGIQPLVGSCLGQADLAAAAEVELEPPEHRRGAGQLHRNLADLLVGTERGGVGRGSFQVVNAGVHGSPFLKIHLVCIFYSIKFVLHTSLT